MGKRMGSPADSWMHNAGNSLVHLFFFVLFIYFFFFHDSPSIFLRWRIRTSLGILIELAWMGNLPQYRFLTERPRVRTLPRLSPSYTRFILYIVFPIMMGPWRLLPLKTLSVAFVTQENNRVKTAPFLVPDLIASIQFYFPRSFTCQSYNFV